MVHKASPVKRGYQDFLVKKATLVQLAPQELGYQGLLDLVDFQVNQRIRWLWAWKTDSLSIDMT